MTRFEGNYKYRAAALYKKFELKVMTPVLVNDPHRK